MDTSAYRIFKKVIINLVVAGTTAKVNPVVLILIVAQSLAPIVSDDVMRAIHDGDA